MLPPGISIPKKKKQAHPVSSMNVPVNAVVLPVKPDAARTTGRPRIYETADDLREAAAQYFAWCDANPLREEVSKYSERLNRFVTHSKPVARPYTMTSLHTFIGVTKNTWSDYKHDKERPDIQDAVIEISETVKDQKLIGAMTGFFNANIVARDLGLADKMKTEQTIAKVPDITDGMDPAEAAELYAASRDQNPI